MIINTENGAFINTAIDLTAPERHILQKLFAWESLVDSMAQFREKKAQALEKGWNNSGPVRESPNLALVLEVLEKKVRQRLKN